MSKFKTKLLAGAAIAMLCSAGFAQDTDRTGWYVGGEAFQFSSRIDGGTAFVMDDDAIGLGAYGGFHFTPLFGLEANIAISDDFSDDRENLRDARLSVVSVMPKLTLPATGTLSFFAKAGLVFVDYAEDYRDTDSDWYDNDASWSDLIIGAGVGAQLEVSPGFVVRLGYDYIDGDLSEDRWSDNAPVRDVDARLEKIGLGMHYQF